MLPNCALFRSGVIENVTKGLEISDVHSTSALCPSVCLSVFLAKPWDQGVMYNRSVVADGADGASGHAFGPRARVNVTCGSVKLARRCRNGTPAFTEANGSKG